MPQTLPTAARLLAALEEVRKVDPEMPVQYLAALLLVYQNPGMSHRDLVSVLRFTSSAAARFAARMSERQSFSVPGLNLIVNETDPYDRRGRQMYLTPRGVRLMKAVEAVLSG